MRKLLAAIATALAVTMFAGGAASATGNHCYQAKKLCEISTTVTAVDVVEDTTTTTAEETTTTVEEETTTTTAAEEEEETTTSTYSNCDDAGQTLTADQDGFGTHLDRDGDNVACEEFIEATPAVAVAGTPVYTG